jgi:hypothetical protein
MSSIHRLILILNAGLFIYLIYTFFLSGPVLLMGAFNSPLFLGITGLTLALVLFGIFLTVRWWKKSSLQGWERILLIVPIANVGLLALLGLLY